MKTVMKAPGLLARFGLVATALLLGQQALAAGTDPGVSVDNRATVTYSVGGTPQTGIESSPTGNNLPGVLDNAAKRGSRNAHTLTRIFMRHALQV